MTITVYQCQVTGYFTHVQPPFEHSLGVVNAGSMADVISHSCSSPLF